MECFAFDMDGVLIETDCEVDKKDLFMNPVIVKFFDVMHEMFKMKRDNSCIDVVIITSRHPNLKSWVKEIFKLEDHQIYMRNFCLDINEIKKTVNNKEQTIDFYNNMVKYKTKILNKLSKKYLKVYFFEDYAGEFKENIPPNVKVMIPWHMEKSNLIY